MEFEERTNSAAYFNCWCNFIWFRLYAFVMSIREQISHSRPVLRCKLVFFLSIFSIPNQKMGTLQTWYLKWFFMTKFPFLLEILSEINDWDGMEGNSKCFLVWFWKLIYFSPELNIQRISNTMIYTMKSELFQSSKFRIVFEIFFSTWKTLIFEKMKRIEVTLSRNGNWKEFQLDILPLEWRRKMFQLSVLFFFSSLFSFGSRLPRML